MTAVRVGDTGREDLSGVDAPGRLWTRQPDGSMGWTDPDATAGIVAQVAHGLTVGQPVRFDGAGFVAAQADTASNAEVVGLVAAVPDADSFVLATAGKVTGLDGLTAGSVYFLDPAVAGGLTDTEPSTVGQVSKPLLIADTSTSGFLFNMRGEVIADPSGGGFVIGSSQLLAITTSKISQPSPLTFDVELTDTGHSVGSDLAIDGLDNTLIDVLTDGLYQVNFNCAISPDTGACTGFIAEMFLSGALSSGTTFWTYSSFPSSTETAGYNTTFSTPPYKFLAGTKLRINLTMVATTGLVSFYGSDLDTWPFNIPPFGGLSVVRYA